MKLVYLISPYRGATPYAVEKNIRYAEDCALWLTEALKEHDAGVVCVHPMTRFYGSTVLDDDYWLELTSEMLIRSDAAWITPWSSESLGGCQAEIELCKDLHIPEYGYGKERGDIFALLEDIDRWNGETDTPISSKETLDTSTSSERFCDAWKSAKENMGTARFSDPQMIYSENSRKSYWTSRDGRLCCGHRGASRKS